MLQLRPNCECCDKDLPPNPRRRGFVRSNVPSARPAPRGYWPGYARIAEVSWWCVRGVPPVSWQKIRLQPNAFLNQRAAGRRHRRQTSAELGGRGNDRQFLSQLVGDLFENSDGNLAQFRRVSCFNGGNFGGPNDRRDWKSGRCELGNGHVSRPAAIFRAGNHYDPE